MTASDDPGRVARDAYTYVHLLIVAGIIATAAGHDLLITESDNPQHGMALAIVVGGPALFLLGGSLFQWRTTGRANAKRLAAAGLLVGFAPLAPHVSALALAIGVTILLTALAIWEVRVLALRGRDLATEQA
jgi:low temperature requirement protein LtrA